MLTERTVFRSGVLEVIENGDMISVLIEGRGETLIDSDGSAEALCRALAAHLGREVGPRGWRATGYELANERGEQEAFIWVEPDGWHSPFSDCVIPGDIGVDVVATAVEALSRDTATEPKP